LVDSPEKRWQHWEDLPPKKEEELIENIARLVVKHRIGLIAQMLLDSGGPFTSLFATLGLGMFGPFLEFFGGDTYAALFRREGNTKRLMNLIEELEDEERSKTETK